VRGEVGLGSGQPILRASVRVQPWCYATLIDLFVQYSKQSGSSHTRLNTSSELVHYLTGPWCVTFR